MARKARMSKSVGQRPDVHVRLCAYAPLRAYAPR